MMARRLNWIIATIATCVLLLAGTAIPAFAQNAPSEQATSTQVNAFQAYNEELTSHQGENALVGGVNSIAVISTAISR